MKLEFEIKVKQEFLPNKRCRKNRVHYVKQNFYTEIQELKNNDFPIAFIVNDYEHRIEEKGQDSIFKLWSNEIRTYNSRLYKALRYNHIAYNEAGWCPLDQLEYLVRPNEYNLSYYEDDEEMFDENVAIIKGDNRKEIENLIKEHSQKYFIFENKIWAECSEPMYNVTTFGLGHNHGGTGFFISYAYNPNIREENYFNALEREKAIEFGMQTASNRGDTESVERIKNTEKNIIVLIPELIKRNPKEEHGDGCEFLNTIEKIVNNSDSANEAGLLAMALSLCGKD